MLRVVGVVPMVGLCRRIFVGGGKWDAVERVEVEDLRADGEGAESEVEKARSG